MLSESINLDQFIQEINRNADAAVSAIRKETDAYVSSELKKAKRKARREISASQFSALDKLNERNNTDLFEAERAETVRLIQRRQEITDEVFAESAERIRRFTATEDYRKLLLALANELAAVLGTDSVFYIRPADKGYVNDLLPYCSKVLTDDSIQLGGIKAVSKQKGLAADHTLDGRLRQQRQLFCEKSGLSVTL